MIGILQKTFHVLPDSVKIQNETCTTIKTKMTIDCDIVISHLGFRIIWARFSQIFQIYIVLKMKLFSRSVFFQAL